MTDALTALFDALDASVERQGLADHRAKIARLAQPCICIRRANAVSPLGTTRIGGAPDLPVGVSWPSKDERFFSFVAQLNMTELPHSPSSHLPSAGMLYFFVGNDEPATDVEHRVLFWNGDTTQLRRAERPPHPDPDTGPLQHQFLNDEVGYIDEESGAEMKLSLSFDADEIGEEIPAAYENVIDEYAQSATWPSQLLGHADTFSGDPVVHAFIKSTGRNIDIVYGGEDSLLEQLDDALILEDHTLATELERRINDILWYQQNKHSVRRQAADEWQLLLALGSHDGMCWWDAGRINFIIRRSDLAVLRFDRTYAEIASS